MLIDYFASHGYIDVVEKALEEMPIKKEKSEIFNIKLRTLVNQYILEGQIDKAVDCLNVHDATVKFFFIHSS